MPVDRFPSPRTLVGGYHGFASTRHRTRAVTSGVTSWSAGWTSLPTSAPLGELGGTHHETHAALWCWSPPPDGPTGLDGCGERTPPALGAAANPVAR